MFFKGEYNQLPASQKKGQDKKITTATELIV